MPHKVKLWGILNVTPDSFYDGGYYSNFEKAVARGIQLEEEGADIIDIGGESTRPGSEPVTLDEEMQRVLPVVEQLARRVKVPISIDTYKEPVARRALDAGASIINDISGIQFDDHMISLLCERKVPFTLMHIKGTPKNMQQNPYYDDVIAEILAYFSDRLTSLASDGVDTSLAIIDPGIGFGKRGIDNVEILRKIDAFKSFGLPILLGTSRKRFLKYIWGKEISPDERLPGSLATYALAYTKNIDYIRVHDVKAAKMFLATLAELL